MKDHVWIRSGQQKLSAMVHIPESCKTGIPVIIYSHGFASDKVGTNNLTRNSAQKMEELGYAVVRFDYRGSGESDGQFDSHTVISGWQEDLASVLTWVKGQPRFSDSPILLYGHSLGGLIVLTHPADEQIVGRIVFAPVTHPVPVFRDIILGPESWQAAQAGHVIRNFDGKDFSLESQFVQDMVAGDYRPIEAAAKLQTSLLILHGTGDDVVPLKGSEELFARYRGPKDFVALDVDHVATGAQPALLAQVEQWLKRNFPCGSRQQTVAGAVG